MRPVTTPTWPASAPADLATEGVGPVSPWAPAWPPVITPQRPVLVAPYGRPDWRWDWGRRTYVMGILNVTPDSFSGDGLDDDIAAAIAHGRLLAAQGADIIDVGGESSHARETRPISLEEEKDRVVPVVESLRRCLETTLISVDTWKAGVAAAALAAGAHLINDVGAMARDPEMKAVAAAFGAPIVVMHSQPATPDCPSAGDPMADIQRFFETTIEAAGRAGVREEQIVLDAGFGFGKSVHQDLLVTRRLRELTRFGRPLLHAPSRKRPIGRVLGCPQSVPERIFGTAATITVGIANGADIVRVHDVLDMVRCVRMSDALIRGYSGPDE
jgi:dihydropteroate synthase